MILLNSCLCELVFSPHASVMWWKAHRTTAPMMSHDLIGVLLETPQILYMVEFSLLGVLSWTEETAQQWRACTTLGKTGVPVTAPSLSNSQLPTALSSGKSDSLSPQAPVLMHTHTQNGAHTHTCTHVHMYIYTYPHTHLHLYIYTHTDTDNCTHAHMPTDPKNYMHTHNLKSILLLINFLTLIFSYINMRLWFNVKEYINIQFSLFFRNYLLFSYSYII